MNIAIAIYIPITENVNMELLVDGDVTHASFSLQTYPIFPNSFHHNLDLFALDHESGFFFFQSLGCRSVRVTERPSNPSSLYVPIIAVSTPPLLAWAVDCLLQRRIHTRKR